MKMRYPQNEPAVKLGNTDIHITPLGIGAWAWGDKFYWGFGKGYNSDDIRSAIQMCIDLGITFFDTAESYGRGRSESYLGEYLTSPRESVVIATKFMPYPWRLTKQSLLTALESSLERLDMDCIDLYQIHWPFPPVPIEVWMEGLVEAVQRGWTRAVGVSNYNPVQTQGAFNKLKDFGIPLASNQVEYNLLNRKIEQSGLIDLCRELNITIIAYSPLAQGLLTGKYTQDSPPPGIRRYRYRRETLIKIEPLLELMAEIGQSHGGKSLSQIALNWTMCKGTVPIPGAKNAHQATENAGALGWRLTAQEIALLDLASEKDNHRFG